ncbi:MAG TPA: cytochrome c [Candidimonas sp.]|nr:cytochrome c [Candidimonas sp.]
MSDFSKRTEAQQREMSEPYEGNRPVPWLVLILVGAAFAWSLAYIGITHQGGPASYGDRRGAADFAVVASSASGVVDGAQIYATQCLACHQASGAGLPGVFPPLAQSEWVAGKAALPIQIVLHGVTGDLLVNGATYNGLMPTFKDKLDDAEIAAVLTYIRRSFGNAADGIDAAAVAAQRKATGARTSPWNGNVELQALK